MSKFVSLITLLMLLIGCGQIVDPKDTIQPDAPPWKAPFAMPTGNVVKTPTEFDAMFVNPLRYEYTREQQIEWFFIRGLKNKSIENKINDTIQQTVNGLLAYDQQNLPPYRGIYTVIDDTSALKEKSLYSYVSYNYNHILSIIMDLHLMFQTTDDTVHVRVSKGLNFDLSTGDQLTLSDLIANNIDAKTYLNDIVSDIIPNDTEFQLDGMFDFGTPIKMTQPFRGLRPDQGFFLSFDSIKLIFDHTTPEFNNRFQSFTLTLEYPRLKHALAIKDRFLTDASLFEDPIIDAIFLYEEPFVPFSRQTTMHKNIPIFISTNSTHPIVSAKIADLLNTIKTMIDQDTDRDIQNAEIFVSQFSLGPYISVSEQYVIFKQDQRVKDYHMNYSLKNDILITSDQLFKQDFDYRRVIFEHIKNDISYMDQRYVSHFAMDNIDFENIAIGNSGLYVSILLTAPDLDEIRHLMMIPYYVLEIKNMPIFDNITKLSG